MRVKRLLVAVFLCGTVILASYIAYRWHQSARSPVNASSPPSRQSIQPRMRMTGMTYTETHLGEVVFEMKIGSLEVNKKKLGFFRVGALSQVELRDVEVDYYELASTGKAPGTTPETAAAEENESQRPDDLYSSLLAAGQSFLGSRSGRLTGFEAHGIQLRYHHADESITLLAGDQLDTQWGGKNLRLRGHARAHYADRVLDSGEILFQPESNTLLVRDGYVLTVAGITHQGKVTKTNLRLQPLAAQASSDGLRGASGTNPIIPAR